MNEINDNIPNQSSVKLADMIVCYRYLGLYKDASVLAMEELGKRRMNGDEFDYEQYIKEKIAELPKMDAKKPGIGSILGMLGKFMGGGK